MTVGRVRPACAHCASLLQHSCPPSRTQRAQQRDTPTPTATRHAPRTRTSLPCLSLSLSLSLSHVALGVVAGHIRLAGRLRCSCRNIAVAAMPTASASKRTRRSLPNTAAVAAPSTSRAFSNATADRRRTNAAQPSDPHADGSAEAVRVSKPKRRRTDTLAQQHQGDAREEAEDETLSDTFAQLSSLLSSLQRLYADAESASSSSDRSTLRLRVDGLLRQLHTLSPSPALPQLLSESSIAAVQSSIAIVTALAPGANSVASHLALPVLQLQVIAASPASFSPIHIHALLQSSALHLCRHLVTALASPGSQVSVTAAAAATAAACGSRAPPAQFEAVTAVPRVAALNRRGDRINDSCAQYSGRRPQPPDAVPLRSESDDVALILPSHSPLSVCLPDSAAKDSE
jgi:hypothetical protein